MEVREAGRTLDAARRHYARGSARIARRATLAGALRGLATGGLAAAAAGVIARGLLPALPGSSADPFPSPTAGGAPGNVALVLLASALVLIGAALGAAMAVPRDRRRAAQWWEWASARQGESIAGLPTAAADRLARPGATCRPFELALLVRFTALPLPGSDELRRAIPGVSPLRLIAPLILAALLAGWPLEGSARSVLGDPTRVSSEEGTAAGSPGRIGAAGSVAEREALVAALRREISLREAAARLLDGSAPLAPLAAALRAGGALALDTDGAARISAADRARLLRAAAELRAGAALAPGGTGGENLASDATEWAERLEEIAEGEPADGTALPRLRDAAGELAAISGGWEEGAGAEGPVAALPPEGAAGGRRPGPARTEPVEGGAPEVGGADPPEGMQPIHLPPGLPFEPGAARGESARPGTTPGALDPRESWLLRPELEPRWFPVIRSYERARAASSPAPGGGAP